MGVEGRQIRLLIVDPGANGAVALATLSRFHGEGPLVVSDAEVRRLPSSLVELGEFFPACSWPFMDRDVYVVSELAGFHRQGFSASSSSRFARLCGRVEMAAIGVADHVYGVYPQAWMSLLRKSFPLPDWRTGSAKDEVKGRKAAIRNLVAAEFPGLKVTLRNADALALMLLTITLLRDHGKLPETFHLQE